MNRIGVAIRVAVAILACSACAPRAQALIIQTEFLGGAPQATAVGGGDLQTIFEAAASVWESAILDPYTIDISYGWAPVGGAQHVLLAQGGSSNRETSGQILFNNDTTLGHFVWFLDPDPLSNSAYGALTEESADLGGGEINVGRTYSGFSSEVGADVLSCLMCSDLFSDALHEIGHALGMSAANFDYIAQSAGGTIDITASLPFSGTRLQLVSNFEVSAHFDNSDVLAGTVMGGRGGYGLREYLSAADILAIAQLSDFRDIQLDPVSRLPVQAPEPSTTALLICGLGLLAVWRRGSRQATERRYGARSTSTQSGSPPPLFPGGVNVCVPVLENVPIVVVAEVVGSNHCA